MAVYRRMTPASRPSDRSRRLFSALARAVYAIRKDRYAHIDFTPPKAVREEARRGLRWRATYNRGGTAIGVARARDLSNGVRISPQTVRRMASYFARHAVDRDAEGWRPGEDGYPSAGRIAWALWGGDAGEAWARKLIRQMNAADNAADTVSRKNAYRQPRLMGLITSNAYQDRDGEYITARALRDWVERARRERRFETYQIPLLWAHNNPELTGIDKPLPVIGWIVRAEVDGAWLLEIALERDHPLAHVIWDAIEAHPDRWKVSHGFHHVEREPRGAGRTYRFIDKFETSVLYADTASNPYTEIVVLERLREGNQNGTQTRGEANTGANGSFDPSTQGAGAEQRSRPSSARTTA